jgi:hypothetical protein
MDEENVRQIVPRSGRVAAMGKLRGRLGPEIAQLRAVPQQYPWQEVMEE